MNPLQIVLIVLAIALPFALFLWHERSQTNPASRWPMLAKMLEFSYSDNPPSLKGQWKERQVHLQAADFGALMTSPMKAGGSFRVEIGPRKAAEEASGMVVPDRIAIPDSALDEEFLIRATPAAAGEGVDLGLLRKVSRFPGAWILAVPGQVEMRLASAPMQAAQVRDAADILVSLADALESL